MDLIYELIFTVRIRNSHNTGIKAPSRTAAAPMIRQLIPDRNRTKMPEAAIRIEVPRSGCLAIRIVGTKIITSAMTMFLKLGGSG